MTEQTGRLSKIDAVMLTTAKDTRVFVRSIQSALTHLVDVDKFYIVTPQVDDLTKSLGTELASNQRVVLVDEATFPFHGGNVTEVMFEAVRERGVYPMSGSSQFEKTLWGRIGWFLQQLLKFYAGKVCKLKDFVLLDSDLIWFTDVHFISNNTSLSNATVPALGTKPKYNGNRYLYASSNQYHAAYLATLPRIAGVPLVEDGKVSHNFYFTSQENLLLQCKFTQVFRSGIVHHIVIVESVLDALMKKSEEKHGILFWQVLLNQRFALPTRIDCWLLNLLCLVRWR
jgi:hypothetical protein